MFIIAVIVTETVTVTVSVTVIVTVSVTVTGTVSSIRHVVYWAVEHCRQIDTVAVHC